MATRYTVRMKLPSPGSASACPYALEPKPLKVTIVGAPSSGWMNSRRFASSSPTSAASWPALPSSRSQNRARYTACGRPRSIARARLGCRVASRPSSGTRSSNPAGSLSTALIAHHPRLNHRYAAPPSTRQAAALNEVDDVARDGDQRVKERDHTPPAEKQRDQRVLPEHAADAGLAQRAAQRLWKTHHQKPDVLLELHLLYGPKLTAFLTVRMHDRRMLHQDHLHLHSLDPHPIDESIRRSCALQARRTTQPLCPADRKESSDRAALGRTSLCRLGWLFALRGGRQCERRGHAADSTYGLRRRISRGNRRTCRANRSGPCR